MSEHRSEGHPTRRPDGRQPNPAKATDAILKDIASAEDVVDPRSATPERKRGIEIVFMEPGMVYDNFGEGVERPMKRGEWFVRYDHERCGFVTNYGGLSPAELLPNTEPPLVVTGQGDYQRTYSGERIGAGRAVLVLCGIILVIAVVNWLIGGAA